MKTLNLNQEKRITAADIQKARDNICSVISTFAKNCQKSFNRDIDIVNHELETTPQTLEKIKKYYNEGHSSQVGRYINSNSNDVFIYKLIQYFKERGFEVTVSAELYDGTPDLSTLRAVINI